MSNHYNCEKKYFEKQKNKIIRYCLYRRRCTKEIEDKLYSTKLNPNQIRILIDELHDLDIINEFEFAKSFVNGKFKNNKWGKNKIIYNLKLKNISTEIIQKAICEIKSNDYIKTIKALIKTKTNQKGKLPNNEKIFRYLIQKGYETDIIKKIL